MAKYTFTINTDASFDPKTKLATWAYWIRSEHFLFKDSGVFPRPLPNSSVAELMAFEKALRRVDKEVPLKRAVKLYINTDSMWVIHALEGRIRHSKHAALAKAVWHAAQGYEIDCRHVRAHTKDLSTKRAWVNDWCDREAKKLLREELGR